MLQPIKNQRFSFHEPNRALNWNRFCFNLPDRLLNWVWPFSDTVFDLFLLHRLLWIYRVLLNLFECFILTRIEVRSFICQLNDKHFDGRRQAQSQGIVSLRLQFQKRNNPVYFYFAMKPLRSQSRLHCSLSRLTRQSHHINNTANSNVGFACSRRKKIVGHYQESLYGYLSVYSNVFRNCFVCW